MESVEIPKENKGALQFLDLMSTIDRYREVNGNEFTVKIKDFISIVDDLRLSASVEIFYWC